MLRSPARLRFYTRAGCGLCDEAKQALAPWLRKRRLELEEVDLDEHPEFEPRFGNSIPVLEYEGRTLAKGRFDVAEVMRRLERRRKR